MMVLKFQNWLELKTTHKRFVKQTTTTGNFEVQKNHLLIGKAATRNPIIKAICDIFRKDVNACSLVIFSGHGVIDGLRLLIRKLRGANYSAKSPKEPYGT